MMKTWNCFYFDPKYSSNLLV